jgi:spermidine synthase
MTNQNGFHKQGEARAASAPCALPYKLMASKTFALLTIVTTSALAFAIGSLSRMYILQQQNEQMMALIKELKIEQQQQLPTLPSSELPAPKLKGEKEVPHAVYTSKVLDTAASSTVRTMLLEPDKAASTGQQVKKLNRADFSECYKSEDDADKEKDVAAHCMVSDNTSSLYNAENEEEKDLEAEEEHLPAGQHLLVDIKNVDSEFLNSEQRLAQAMVDVVWESDLTLLSYHCHSLFPMGVSCVGVLLESHISFHTWPEQGVITLDLFTCGSGLLIPVVPIIERLFAVPQVDDSSDDDDDEESEIDAPVMIWSHKYRGFHDNWDADPDSVPPLSERKDYGLRMSKMDTDMKEIVASVETPFQQIDIIDTIHSKFSDLLSYRRSIDSSVDTYESQHPEYFRPNRIVYLDGVLQSTRHGDEPYHEGLVHPGMLAHPNPKRAAIIGGGEGATLREVLRHDTIEHVKMIEIDELMVNTSRTFLPDWSSCDDIENSTPNCFDEPRADVRMEDALAYFINTFASSKKDPSTGKFSPEIEAERYDVIFMDALDPQDNVVFARFLYSNDDFTEALFNALTDNGVMIMQLGIVPRIHDLPDEMSKSQVRASLEQDLVRFGFKSIHQYEESGCDFGDSWSYIVAFKDYATRRYWYDDEAAVNLKIQERIRRTVSGKPALKSFDGATMAKYQVPHSAFEEIFCRSPFNKSPTCKYLRGYEPDRPNTRASAFKVQKSPLSVDTGYGVFATVDIPKGSMIMQEKSSNSIHFSPSTWELMNTVFESKGGADSDTKSLKKFVETFGYENNLLGETGYDISSSLLMFINHGCNGTWNVNSEDSWTLTEQNADPEHFETRTYSKGSAGHVFNPVIARHLPHLMGGYDIATRDIQAGEEILDSFLTTIGSAESWAEVVKELRAACKLQESSS